ncbi:hypothetical protein QNH48_28380 [Neobacillus sp. YX16]|uniref:hypothetical protein n=1 Tax=Neobacillus sp. YX16 TaxID=3047874 RepID=UPI0024C3F644|nr:hypothetical protein [Neobacillus sp. YX16]WHZ02791.1 hypothetical protein QNH48_28380 [Neobacillus sp. YX16]
MKKNKLILFFLSVVLIIFISTSETFADSKKQLEQIIMDHEFRITKLEQSGSPNENIAPDVKQNLIQEAEFRAKNLSYYDDSTGQSFLYNVTKVDVIERDGKVYLQIFLEGDYKWGQSTTYGYTHFEDGRFFAYNLVNSLDTASKLYDVVLHYEFYQNGEKIKFTF